MTITTAPPPVVIGCRRLRVRPTSAPARVAAAVAEAVRREGTVEVEAIGADALQLAIEGIATARLMLAHDGREIAVSPALEDGPTLRLQVLRAALSAGQLHADGRNDVASDHQHAPNRGEGGESSRTLPPR